MEPEKNDPVKGDVSIDLKKLRRDDFYFIVACAACFVVILLMFQTQQVLDKYNGLVDRYNDECKIVKLASKPSMFMNEDQVRNFLSEMGGIGNGS